MQASLLTDLHSRLVHGTTLELRFHLAVKARVRLLAKRRKKVVASTPTRTLAAGNRKLLLRLNPHDWPTKLSLQTHALAPLPTTTVKEAVGGPEHGGAGSNTVSTGLTVLPHVPSFARIGIPALRLFRKRSGTVPVRPSPCGALLLASLLALAVVLALTGVLPGPGATSRAAAQPGSGETVAQTDDSVPARERDMIGSSPAEAPGETWGIGEVGSDRTRIPAGIVRYTTAGGWSLAPGPLN